MGTGLAKMGTALLQALGNVPTPDDGTRLADPCDLRNVLARLQYVLGPRSDEMLSRYLRRGPAFKDARFQPFLDKADYAPAMNTMGAAIGFLHALYHCFLSIDAEHQSFIRNELPVVARPDNSEAPRRFFMDYMSDQFEGALLPSLLDAEVADLTNVVFDLRDDPIGPETVESRRKMRARKMRGV
jgi:hypothetical protein